MRAISILAIMIPAIALSNIVSRAEQNSSAMGAAKVFERLENADQPDDIWKIRTLVIRDLLRLDDSQLPQVRARINHINPDLQIAAMRVLGLKKDELSRAQIERLLLESDDQAVRVQAVATLAEIGNPDSRPLLEKTARDENRNVKHRSELALGRYESDIDDVPEIGAAYLGLAESSFNEAEIGRPAPPVDLKDWTGKDWSIEKVMQGKKYLALIWIGAEWCSICNRTFHDLIELQDEFAANGFAVATVECFGKYRVSRMVADRDIWWPHLSDPAGAVGAVYGVDPLVFTVHGEWMNRPSTIIIDSTGAIVYKYHADSWGDRPTVDNILLMMKTGEFNFKNPKH